ncbi:HNH endonuclease [Lacticaseibacillus paracasei]|uniref:HNH endonuclease family protein n=1 Tax=Lacticaseibacillus paracasei subsp. paracasei Lpp41 TaxID=1256208 RepID=A0A829H6Y2_LACPA|nr:HNH endonuclease [Lacticaseibacillus paracasei]EPC73213.1 HNH endonuclease family protein [Lacticaseibacillus paracasei subsp. paracasei Lpp41]MDE3285515.1 HNH endonuclease [Lacticaseibacillus paracasei]
MTSTVNKELNLEYFIKATLKAHISACDNEEEFKQCPKPFSRYKISRNGVVIGPRSNRPIKQYINSCGYVILGVTKDGSNRHTTVTLSRLLALAWISNPEHLSDVDHIDNNRLNNNLSNLRWVSHRDNLVKEHRRQLMKRANGRPVRKVYDDDTFDEVYSSIKEAAEVNELSNTSVAGSANGTLHLNKSYHFVFAQ